MTDFKTKYPKTKSNISTQSWVMKYSFSTHIIFGFHSTPRVLTNNLMKLLRLLKRPSIHTMCRPVDSSSWFQSWDGESSPIIRMPPFWCENMGWLWLCNQHNVNEFNLQKQGTIPEEKKLKFLSLKNDRNENASHLFKAGMQQETRGHEMR